MPKYLDTACPALQAIASGGLLTDGEQAAIKWLALDAVLREVGKDEPWLLGKKSGIRRALSRGRSHLPLNYFEVKLVNLLLEAVAVYAKKLNEAMLEMTLRQRHTEVVA